MIDILIPTLGRSQRIAGIVDNITSATVADHRVWFVAEDHDTDTIEAVKACDLVPIINSRRPNYSGAISTAYTQTDGDLLFAGADDLNFHPGWDVAAAKHMDGWIGVVGTNDLLNPYVLAGMHATHYFVARWYLDDMGGVVDEGPGSFLCDRYQHQFTDTEFIATAKARARFRPCLESVVEHMHHTAGKMKPDATSRKAYACLGDDELLYESRKHLWVELSR